MTTETTTKPLTAGEISTIIRRDLSRPGSFSMKNVYVKGSPWESDVIRVLRSGYWHEYVVKKAPRLKKPSKLSWAQLFNLCLKK